MGIRTAILSLLSAGLIFAAGAAAAAPPATAATPPVKPLVAESGPSNPEYILGPEDVIDIEVVGQPDKAHARIYSDGTVQLNLVGKISATGKTTRQLGDEIAAALKTGGYYANPVVNIEVSSFSSRYVTVLGAVGSPGLVPINRPYRLSEVLARVGGVRQEAADYVVVTPENGKEQHYSIENLATGGSNEDPYVPPGAKVFAPAADIFYVTGQVNAPGTFALKTGMTVRQAIARAGGLKESGTDHGVLVTRGEKKMKLEVGATVQAGDVLMVRERLF